MVPTPFSLVVTGITIYAFNTGATGSVTPTVMQWFASADQITGSLAAAGAHRRSIGVNSIPTNAAIGAQASGIVRDFSASPLHTGPGRYFTLGMKIPIGAATASQVIRGVVGISGYFE